MIDDAFSFIAHKWAWLQHAVGWKAFEKYLAKYSLGAIVAAMVSGAVVFIVARKYTKRIKQIDSTLEFSRRFHELMQQQRDLNRRYATQAKATQPPTDGNIEVADAEMWWWRFFDLILYEFDFYQSGFLRKERFNEWMLWRWYDAQHPDQLSVCGMNYRDGWAYWTAHSPNQRNRLVRFLETIHAAHSSEAVTAIVKQNGPRFLRPAHLD
jgi:hypothetical protein